MEPSIIEEEHEDVVSDDERFDDKYFSKKLAYYTDQGLANDAADHMN